MSQHGSGASTRTVRDVVFVDGIRTPFGRAGEKGIYAGTRADDLIVKCIRGLLRRNPSLPAERIDEVAIAATTQTGDQGLTLGRTAALRSPWAPWVADILVGLSVSYFKLLSAAADTPQPATSSIG